MTRKKKEFSFETALNLLALETGLPRLSSHAHSESNPATREGYDDDWDSPWVDLGGEG